MKTIKIIGLVVLALIAVYVEILLVSPRNQVAGVIPVAQFDASHFTQPIYAGAGIVTGGSTFATSSANGVYGVSLGNDALVESEFIGIKLIEYTPTQASTTLKLPSSFSTIFANVGDSSSIFLKNSTSTALVNIILSAPSTGTTMTMGTTSAIVHPGEVVKIECQRLSSVTTTCLVI